MSLPYPVGPPDSGDPGRPYLPNVPSPGNQPPGSGYPYPCYNNEVPPPAAPGYPPTPSSMYPSVPSPSTHAYPPAPSGYPSNPGGYSVNPTPGPGYPPIPASTGYPNSSPYPNIPPEAPQITPSAYPSAAATPNSNHPYPTNPGYPNSNPSAPSAPPMSQGNDSSTPYPSSGGYPYPSGPPGQNSYPSRPQGQNPYPSGPFQNSTSSGYPGAPGQERQVRGLSFPSDPKGNSATARIAHDVTKRIAAPNSVGIQDVKNAAKKVFKPLISSGLDRIPINGELRDKLHQYASDPKSSDMRDYNHQNFKEIKTKLLKQRKLFEDPEFPASNSLLVDKYNGQEFVVSYFGRSKYENKTIKWLRPHEICKAIGNKKNPEMFVGATNRFDINQGELGNCWFLAALSNLVEDKRYLSQVIPPDQSFDSSYAGIFRFRFWRYGSWVEVVVDDRLPTRNGKLIFLRSIDSNEFWGALLEKAYAKLHGSYKALEGGLTIEASVDFTGGIPELISIDNLSMSKERLFYLMSSADRNGAFMGAAVTKRSGFSQEAKNKGLQTRHAYTITKVVEIRSRSCNGGIPLIRIRNPHGNSKEWKGDWADGDKHWKVIPVNLREKIGLTFEDDGEFYMSFSDFCRFFGELEICHLTPDAAVVNFDPQASKIKRFEVFNYFGSWSNAKNTSGGCGNAGQKAFSGNPQFFLDLKDPDPYDDEIQCSIIVSLLQKNIDRSKECIAIGFKVYRCNPGTNCLSESFLSQNLSVDRTETFMNLREISKRMFLPEGRYCFIPCPFRKGEEAEFLLRVFVQRSWGSSEQSEGKLVKGTKDPKHADMHKFAEDFDSKINTFGHRYKGEQKGKIKNAAGKALNILEQHFPDGSKGLKKLKQFYNWAKDKDSEFDLLKKIIKSF